MADPDLLKLAQMLQKPPQGYGPETAPGPLQPLYKALEPEPGAEYGTIMPWASGGEGDHEGRQMFFNSNARWAMPSSVREGLGGILDLMSGVDTGQVTPRAAETLALGGLGTGSIFAKEGALASGGAPIRAYHGSPHDFERFDASKIGTGEGAQAYGHGLYFAENEGVAKGYRDKLGIQQGGQKFIDTPQGRIWGDAALEELTPEQRAAYLSANSKGDASAALANARKFASEPYSNDLWGPVVSELEKNAPAYHGQAWAYPGKMYEVNIHADPARFLDWDKPLSVQAASKITQMPQFGSRLDPTDPIINGQHIIAELANTQGGQSAASNVLSQAGIPGIRYLDAGSRSAGQGSSNYVVFPGNEHLIDILRKYMMGVPAPVAAPQQGSIFNKDNSQ